MISVGNIDDLALSESAARIAQNQSNIIGLHYKMRNKTAFDKVPYMNRLRQKTVSLKFCKIVWVQNKTRVQRYFMSCSASCRRLLNAFLKVIGIASSSVSQTKSEQIEIHHHFKLTTSDENRKLDNAFADAIIKDGGAFNTCQSAN